MNIFIDTTVLYKDPFLKGNFSKELIAIVREREVNLYVSTVVLKELRRNYSKIVDEENQKLGRLIDNAEHYGFSVTKLNLIDKSESIKQLDGFYSKLESEGIIRKLDFDNNDLPEIVERAVWRRKPFTETKTELKDTITWLTYVKFAEGNSLKDCILLTENVNDFCDGEKMKQNIFEIHPELKKDSDKFKIYKSPKELIQSEKKKLQFVDQRFEAWIRDQDFDDDFVREIIEDNFRQTVEEKIKRKYEESSMSDIFGDGFFVQGYLAFNDFDFGDVENINVDLFKDECLVSGELFVHSLAQGYEYVPVREPGEDNYRFMDERDLTIKLTFSFYYDRKEIPRHFEIDRLELEEVG